MIMVVVVVVAFSFAVIMASVGISIGASELLSSGSLSLRVEVLDLGLAKDAI
jgi:hypothetical protein